MGTLSTQTIASTSAAAAHSAAWSPANSGARLDVQPGLMQRLKPFGGQLRHHQNAGDHSD